MTKVLLVEDDSAIADIITYYLEEMEQYQVTKAASIQEGRLLKGLSFDVVLLDVMLPDGNGVDFCEELRKIYSCPVLFISCIDDDDVIIKALEKGGDDYIVKPFSNQILHAKIQANLRRITHDNKSGSSNEIKSGNLILDTEKRTVTADGITHQLGNIDLHLLCFFFEHPRRYYMSSELYRLIWGKSSNGDTRTVMVHICNIRKMIEKNPADPQRLRNIVGRGYWFDPEA